MGNNPINPGLRFILEIMTLVAVGLWGWTHHEGWLKYLLVIG